MDSHDHLVFHLGSSPKFVRHAFEHALAAAHCGDAAGGDAAGGDGPQLVAGGVRRLGLDEEEGYAAQVRG